MLCIQILGTFDGSHHMIVLLGEDSKQTSYIPAALLIELSITKLPLIASINVCFTSLRIRTVNRSQSLQHKVTEIFVCLSGANLTM